MLPFSSPWYRGSDEKCLPMELLSLACMFYLQALALQLMPIYAREMNVYIMKERRLCPLEEGRGEHAVLNEMEMQVAGSMSIAVLPALPLLPQCHILREDYIFLTGSGRRGHGSNTYVFN